MGMTIRVVGHACLHASLAGQSLVVDPWLLGSAYWRSWWHYPEPAITPDLFDASWIYLSHEHFDHFHYPSLRRFDRKTPIIIPRFARKRMGDSLEWLGFTDVRELSHGESLRLENGLTIRSYQYGLDDSALVVEDGESVVLDLVDSKVTGPALRQILQKSPRVDLLLRSHAAAQGYPACFEAEDPADLKFRDPNDYVNMFMDTIRIVQPRYAIPFASNICTLHRETYAFNEKAASPVDVAAACAAANLQGTQVVAMSPGDSWNKEAGFRLRDPSAYLDKEAAIEALAVSARPKLEAAYAAEDLVLPDFKPFEDYFGRFMAALPPGMKVLFKARVVFDQPLHEKRYWLLDFSNRTIVASAERPSGIDSLVTIHPAVLMDAVGKGIVNFILISKRLRVWVKAGSMMNTFKFWGLIELFEMGYLPVTNLMNRRAMEVLWARRVELRGIGRFAVGRKAAEERAVPRVY